MKNIIKTFSLLSLMAVIPGAFAATSRVSMISKASPRLPSIAAYIAANNAATTVVGTTATTYMADIDCVNNYTECIKGADACGSDFSECTTNVALHAKMPNCLSVLSQCSSSGVASLFGTSNLAAITTPIKNSDGDITGYTYPSAGSALEQMVTASAISNRLTKDQCVKKYTTCLHKDSVCGDDFELCTDEKEFKKQALSCDSVLARCQSDGKTELFGSSANAEALKAAAGTRIAEMISAGAQLAAVNAVSTCYKVADQCIMNACAKNPTRCLEGRNKKQVKIADNIADGTATAADTEETTVDLTTAADVKKFIKGACLDTIGTNKYCYATVAAENSGSNLKFSSEKIKSYTHLSEDEIEEVFEDLYSTRMRDSLKKSITDLAEKFDAKAKDACVDTISTCAMRSCGGGIGSVCYTQSKTTDSVDIRVPKSYKEIQSACGAIVNTDSNCQYAASDGDSVFAYNYIDNSVFSSLVPADAANGDPIGVVASLNALLATSYNDVAIENMRKQCQAVALSCVKSMCGKDYINCYRNRTDIAAGTYGTDMTKFNASMNKMGGVIDYNIVIGLCMNTVQNSSVCEEHLKIALNNEMTNDKIKASWGSNETVRNAWADANSVTAKEAVGFDEVVVGCTVSKATDDCPTTLREDADDNGNCIGIVDENGCVYDKPLTQKLADYQLGNAAETLFQQLLVDVEKEAQAKHNAKLTKEQSVCLSSNNGGIIGAADNGSTFMWVKLNSNKIPKNYNMKGLSTKQFKASNDLYGSFCRARITVTSDDRAIQEALGDKATAYFAVGDAFTCGSWIDKSTLEKITKEVAEKARKDAGEGSTKEKIAYAWGTIAPALAGGAIGTGLTESGLIGGWLNSADQKNSNNSTQKQQKTACIAYADEATKLAADTNKTEQAKKVLNAAATKCKVVVNKDDQKDCIEDANDIAFSAAMIKTACESAPDTKTSDKSNTAARIAIPIATTVAGGALGAGITASVLQAKYETAANEAVAAWMEEIGEHIQCYLGADELGSYGDVISIEVE